MLEAILARAGRLAGVLTKPLERPEPVLDVAARFAAEPGTVLLQSGGELDCARHHILGLRPWLTLRGRADQMNLTIDGQSHELGVEPFDLLRALVDHFQLAPPADDAPLRAGLLGYLAYDLKDRLERLPRTSVDDQNLPHIHLIAPSVLVVFDRPKNRAVALAPWRDRPGGRQEAQAALDGFFRALQGPPPAPGAFARGPWRANFARGPYMAAVERIRQYIAAGDVYQVNMSQRFEADFSGDAFALHRALHAANPAPFFAFVNAGDHQIVCTSPERFLLQRGDWVETRPIKGTRPRLADPAQDEAMGRELQESPKDAAELSMIVDLLRNDLGRSCAAQSVRVLAHKRLEAWRNVYHLVSLVEGRLAPGKRGVDLLEGCFPGGSITGCPKIRAMEIIDELEPNRRHIYTGSIGYIGFDQTMDLNIAIRTVTIAHGRASFGVGGGVVYDSDPAAEYDETLHKGRTLLEVMPGPGEADRSRPMVWLNGLLSPAVRARVHADDRGLLWGDGFFETIRLQDGQAPLLARHLARWERAWQALDFGPVPDLTWPQVIDQVLAANGLERGLAAVKILATRGRLAQTPALGPTTRPTLLVTARPYAPRGADGLRLITYPQPRQSPLAAHKTTNYLYYLLAGRHAAQAGADEALILNPDGGVSETNSACLIVIEGRRAVAPSSPHVLAGVMQQRLLEELSAWGYQTLWRAIRPEELLRADQLIVANALIGPCPALSLDGAALPQGDPTLCPRLARAVFADDEPKT